MANLVNHSVTNLINGVSQQAPAVRLDNQLEEQINCFSDVTKGLTIRNGLELMNVSPDDLTNRIPIEFSISGNKYILGLNALDTGNELKHVPIIAGTQPISASLVGSAYFKNATRDSIKVVETKDKVFVLNKNMVVATSSSSSAYYDISLVDSSTGVTATDWTQGSYTITVASVADTASGNTTTSGSVTITVLPADTPSTIVSKLKSALSTGLAAELGTIEAIGNKGSFRLYFNFIPRNFKAPLVTISTGTVSGTYTYVKYEPDASPPWNSTLVNKVNGNFIYDTGFRIVEDETFVPNNSYSYDPYLGSYGASQSGYFALTTNIYWNGTLMPNGVSTTAYYKYNGWTYYRGPIVSQQTYPDGTSHTEYSIRREQQQTATSTYTPTISSPINFTGTLDDKFDDKGMIWVTGVSSGQVYTVNIEYKDISGIIRQVPTITVAVDAPAKIKLNYVAEAIRGYLDASADFTCSTSDIYDNALYFYSTVSGANTITSISVSNNYDTTSIHAVTRATINNSSGIIDQTILPPRFRDGFKVRIGTSASSNANYYLRYDAAFQGWKETGLDDKRELLSSSMPYIIDKHKVVTSDTIVLEPSSWAKALAGDTSSNKDPSFINKKIKDIFFYGSRLGIASEDSLVMSAINKHDHFYRTTTSKVLEDDRVDIQLDSSKIGYAPISNVTAYSGKLLVNTGKSQSVLLVNNAFNLTSARLSEVSSYTLGNFKPLPVNDSLYFSVSGNGKTSIYNYTVGGNGAYQSFNLTKHIPSYLNGNIRQAAYANNTAIVHLDEDDYTLYVQNRFSADGRLVQNAWHKWTLPYPVSYFTFYGNNLYVFMTATDSNGVVSTLVCKYDIIPQVVTQVENQAYIGWTPYLDCYTKDKTLIENFPEFIGINDQYGNRYDSDSLTAAEVAAGITPVQKAYDSTTVNQTSVGTDDGPYYSRSGAIYYWHVAGDKNEIVFNSGATLISGNNGSSYFDAGGYRYTKGAATADAGYYEVSRAAITSTTFNTNDMLYGIPFKASITLSEIVPRQQGQDGSYTVMNYARLMLHRMRMSLANSGVFKVIVSLKNRVSHTKIYTGAPLGQITLGKSGISDVNFRVPINGQSDNVTITLESDSAQPFNLLSTEWQGKLIQRGRNI